MRDRLEDLLRGRIVPGAGGAGGGNELAGLTDRGSRHLGDELGARVAAQGLAVVDEGLVPEGLGVHEGAVHVPQDSAHREVGSGGGRHEK